MDIVNVSDHVVSPAFTYLFDTNVWLFIYGPLAGTQRRKQSRYSALLRQIIDRKATVFVPSLVLAEYFNAVLRISFQQWKRKNNCVNAEFKKNYRPTEDFRLAMDDAISQVKEILSTAQQKPDEFQRINMEEILSSIAQSADYNDVFLAKTCEITPGLKFVSDDADIRNLQMRITLIADL